MTVLARLLLIGALMLGTGQQLLFAQDSRRDGNWWQTQELLTKTVYVIGLFDGMDLGRNFSYWKFVNDRSMESCLGAVGESFNEYTSKFMKNVTSGQLTDGLNSFYQDYRNRRIMVHDAVWLVLNEIAGTPRDKLDAMIENWRRSAGS